MSEQQFKKPDDPFAQLFKKQEAAFKKPDFGLPDRHDAARIAGIKDLDLDKLDSEEEERALAREREAEEQKSEEEAQESARLRASERAERRRRMKQICFCGDDDCRIGPFTLTREVEE